MEANYLGCAGNLGLGAGGLAVTGACRPDQGRLQLEAGAAHRSYGSRLGAVASFLSGPPALFLPGGLLASF